MHDRYDADERRLLDAASDDLWTSDLVDMVVDVASPVLDAAQWRGGAPEGSPKGWSERSTAILSLAGLALRQTRVVAMAVRSGYAPEAHGPYRRLQEAAGHAQGVAGDPTGAYAENWMHGRGKAAKPSVAFAGGSGGDPLWKLMSGHAHAHFEQYVNFSAHLDDQAGLVHRLNPSRDVLWDNCILWMTARRLTMVLAAIHQVHEHIDQENFLAVGTHVVEGEARLERELGATMSDRDAA